MRAGVIRPVEPGRYACLPLGWRAIRRADALVRAAVEDLGGQEMWWPPGRDGLKAVVELARREVHSYRDLPRLVYRVGAEERHGRLGKGLLAALPPWGMEAYSLHADGADLDGLYARVVEAWEGIASRCGLEWVWAEAGLGEVEESAMLIPHPAGEDRLVRCPGCGYAATADTASFRLPSVDRAATEPLRPVPTPGCATIADVAAYVGVATSQTLKAVFYAWERADREPTLVFVVVRGDLEVSEAKLRAVLGEGTLHPASDGLIRAAGAEPGYASPVGLDVRSDLEGEGVLVVGDRSIEVGANFVAGANREGYHLTGVNYPRDFAVTLLADVAQVQPGHLCPRCGEGLEMEAAVEVGRCGKWGTGPAERAEAGFVDREGRQRPLVMGAYGFAVSRLVAVALEAHHDEDGLVWPPAVAPFDAHLVSLARSDEERAVAERIYGGLQAHGLEALYDDRSESAGVKFADADLIGCPVRLTVSRRSLKQGGVEVKARWTEDRAVVPEEGLVERVRDLLDSWAGL